MCTEQSYPIKTFRGVTKPMTADSPVVGQPPLLTNDSSAVCGDARGAMTHNGTMMAKMPQRCKIKMTPSIRGSFTASSVLKKMAEAMTAIVRSVACHLCGTYVSSFRAMRP